MDVMPTTTTEAVVRRRWVGGAAALYLALALMGAIPYFLLVVDYPSAENASEKVEMILDHYPTLYAVYLITYVLFGVAVSVLALSLKERLQERAPFEARVAAALGLLWAAMLVGSGLVFTYGMTTIDDLASSNRSAAVVAWQSIEPVALALGSAGGELLGGLWVLSVSLIVVRHGALPTGLGWLGIVIGAIGVVTTIPALNDLTVAFGLLQIVWLLWLGGVLLTTQSTEQRE